ncbi:MAG: tyrosine-type recombinase/integrase [Hyphomicrobium sp.]
MATQKLTKRVIDGTHATDRDYIVWDSDLAGFGIRLRPGGSKTFIAQYRAGGGRTGQTRRYTVGRYGVMTVEEARLEARAILLSAAQGHDPAGKRHAKRRETKIAELVTQFAKEGTDHLKERNRRCMLARINHHIVPLLGWKKISEVRIGDVEQMMRDVKAGKTAKDEKTGVRSRVVVKGGAGAATRAVRDLSSLFTFAIRQELATANPCSAVKKAPDQRRTRFLTLDEIKRLGVALSELEAEGANEKAIAIMRLWALTGCRRDEIAALKWSEIDFDKSCLRLDDSKTGKSVRPLASAALAIVNSLKPEADCPFVFPSEDGNTFYQGTKRYWVKVVKLAALPGVTPHTLRHTIGSAAVSTGETLAMTGALLGHANQYSTSIYAHMQQDPARHAADRVVGPIAKALGVQQEAAVMQLIQEDRSWTAELKKMSAC